ncbi:MAG TPA: ThiF family adenylyltransferase [Rhizomicrobium sp.]|nr:ThiF family adenylyltransferase [Rhizomicrobium sp.]
MSSIQIDRSPDLLRLRTDGYNIRVTKAAYLVVEDVPYVNSKGKIAIGALVSKLDLAGDVTAQPGDHTMRFTGEHPCDSNGQLLDALKHSTADQDLGDGLVVNHMFSRKPSRGHYLDYHEKVTHYVDLIGAPVAIIDPDATARTGRVIEPDEDDSPFRYLDTNSARAEVNVATQKLAVEAVAIVGLGGTGSYVLDLVAKCPVGTIHLYDKDRFLTHNAFRAPGAPTVEELRLQPHKVDYYQNIYSHMHRGIVAHPVDVDASNVEELRGMSFVFLCMDGGKAKKLIVEKLEEYGVPFIDVSMGLYAKNDTIGGSLQVVTSTPERRDGARTSISFADDAVENEYDTNIQVADLNAINACLAVIKWKKLRQFYFDRNGEQFSCYKLSGNLLINDDKQ